MSKKLKTIQQALEKEITRGNCKTCPKRVFIEDDLGGFYECSVTEEIIGSGECYCDLKESEQELYAKQTN